MHELVNFSEYPVDLERFNYDWDDVQSFIRSEGIDGIELLISTDTSKNPVPHNLVSSVHLPGWFGWVRTWREPYSVPGSCDPLEIACYYGAQTPDELLQTFNRNLDRAASLRAAYAVFHIAHVELEEVYTRSFRYRSWDVLESAASFLNAGCSRYPSGEPPITLAFENLWWPGLTFRSEKEVQYFRDLLNFDNWMFVLDTGHLMNALNTRSEQEGIQKVITALEQLSEETMARIQAVHLQCSTSGTYQNNHFQCPAPPGFSSLTYQEKMIELMHHIPYIDEHRPFSDSSCNEIIDLIQPDYLVHEFITRSRKELQEGLRKQKRAIFYSGCNP